MSIEYRNRALFIEGVDARVLAADLGTPTYVYSRAAMEAALREYQQALAGCEHLVCYAVKANSNLAVLDVLADWLRSGKDHLGASAAEDVEDELLAAEVWVSAALGNRLVVKL